MITSLPEEVLIEVLVKMGRYKIDDEVFKEAERLYDERLHRGINQSRNQRINQSINQN